MPLSHHRPAALAAATLLAGVVVSAQSPSAPPAPPFHAATELVQVDAIVEDASGAFVSDLSPGDFEVSEDGQPQQISAFYFRTTAAAAAAAWAGGAAAPMAGTGAAPHGGTVFILLFDDDHLTAGGFKRVQAAAEQFLREQFRAGDLGGVVVNGTMAHNRLTNDREELLEAVRTAKSRPVQSTRRMDMREWPRLLYEYEAVRIADGDRAALDVAVRRACTDDPDECDLAEGAILSKARQIATEVRTTTERTLSMLDTLFTGLEKLEGSKAVIFLSEGFAAEESWPAVRRTVGLAARAGVRLYALDAHGIAGSAGRDLTGQHAGDNEEYASMLGRVDTQSDAPNTLAVDTGGFVVRHANALGTALARIGRDAGNYYVLGYRSTNGALDGAFRRIRVRVRRPGLHVRARRGYVATPLAQPTPAVADASAWRDLVDAGVRDWTRELAQHARPEVEDRAQTTVMPDVQPRVGATAHRLRPDADQRVEALQETSAIPVAAGRLSDVLSARAAEGWAAYERGDVEGAQRALHDVVGDAAAPPWTHYALGQAEYALARYAAAARSWEVVHRLVPEFEPVYFDLADAYLQLKDRAKALVVLRVARTRWPADGDVLNAIGVIEVGRGALDAAIETFDDAVRASPGDGVSVFNLAKTLELRYYRDRRYVPLYRRVVGNEKDLKRAREQYQRYLEIGGLFENSAREGLQRLEWAEAARR